jgi:hypothetical protein
MPGATPAAWPTRRPYTRNLDDFHGHDRLIDAVAVQSRTAKTVTWVSGSGETVRLQDYRLTNYPVGQHISHFTGKPAYSISAYSVAPGALAG